MFDRAVNLMSVPRAILDNSDFLIRREDEACKSTITHNHERLGAIVRFGLEPLDTAQCANALDLLHNHNAGLQTRADIIEDQARQHGLYSGDKQKGKEASEGKKARRMPHPLG